jgi:LPS O-antigen subunit length determinant protein (WzzB/FepE family)
MQTEQGFSKAGLFPSEELSLGELLTGFYRHKLLIAGCVLSVLGIAIAYLLYAKPIYRTRIILKPPTLSELSPINNSGFISEDLKGMGKKFEAGRFLITPEEALERMADGLESYENRFSFYQEHKALFQGPLSSNPVLEESLFAKLSEDSFKMIVPDQKKQENPSDFTGLEMLYSEGIDGPAILNGFAAWVESKQIAIVRNNLETLVQSRLNQLERELAAARTEYNARKHLNIALIEEAIAVAKSLGIMQPRTPSSFGEELKDLKGNLIKTEITNQNVPLYFMGSVALEAELKVLQERGANPEKLGTPYTKDEDLFVLNFSDNQKEMTFLKSVQLNEKTIRMAHLDQPAVKPLSPIAPRRMLILAAALVMGTVLGLLAASALCIIRR